MWSSKPDKTCLWYYKSDSWLPLEVYWHGSGLRELSGILEMINILLYFPIPPNDTHSCFCLFYHMIADHQILKCYCMNAVSTNDSDKSTTKVNLDTNVNWAKVLLTESRINKHSGEDVGGESEFRGLSLYVNKEGATEIFMAVKWFC